MILGVSGRNGAGKGEVVRFLEERSFYPLSLSDVIFAVGAAPVLVPDAYGGPIPRLAEMPDAVQAIAELAREEVSEVAAKAYSGETPVFGPNYLIPSPFDPRLILRIAPAVARAAAASGVAARPITDFDAYLDQLNRFVWRSGFIMKPIFAAAKKAEKKRVIFAEGEDERVLRAAQVLMEENIAKPILIGLVYFGCVVIRRYPFCVIGQDAQLSGFCSAAHVRASAWPG